MQEIEVDPVRLIPQFHTTALATTCTEKFFGTVYRYGQLVTFSISNTLKKT
jgi:hypothetical protein